MERWRRGDAPRNPAAFVFTIARRRASRAAADVLATFAQITGDELDLLLCARLSCRWELVGGSGEPRALRVAPR